MPIPWNLESSLIYLRFLTSKRCFARVVVEKTAAQEVSLRIDLILKRSRPTDGGLAQLGERLNGIQKVNGSSPLSSTPQALAKQGLVSFLGSASEGRGCYTIATVTACCRQEWLTGVT